MLFVGYCYYINILSCIQVKLLICCKHAAFIDNILFSIDAEILSSTNRTSVTYSFLVQSFILAFFYIGLINDIFTFKDCIHSGTDAAALVGDVLVRIQLDAFTSDTATKVIDVLTFKVYCSVSLDGAKGERISDYGIDAIARIEDWYNNLPRKILGYKTPDELFEAKLDEIYSA